MTDFWLRFFYPLISTGLAILVLMLPLFFLESWVHRVTPWMLAAYLALVPVVQVGVYLWIGRG